MLLLTDKYVFNLDDIVYVAVYDSEHIRIVYKNKDEIVFTIKFEDFMTSLDQLRIR